MITFNNSWDELLKDEFKKEYYLSLREFLKAEYSRSTVYPNMHDIYNSLKLTDFKDVRVVILGQDPYHQPNQAHGLCFSVKEGVAPPPSLLNIFKEIESDIGVTMPSSGVLTGWAQQGVLLLNTVLTVRESCPNSHKNKGWEVFTDRIIALLNQSEKPVVYLLWGANAKSKAALIDTSRHFVLTAPHPSPLSAYSGFMGCKHFSKANKLLEERGQTPIIWENSGI